MEYSNMTSTEVDPSISEAAARKIHSAVCNFMQNTDWRSITQNEDEDIMTSSLVFQLPPEYVIPGFESSNPKLVFIRAVDTSEDFDNLAEEMRGIDNIIYVDALNYSGIMDYSIEESDDYPPITFRVAESPKTYMKDLPYVPRMEFQAQEDHVFWMNNDGNRLPPILENSFLKLADKIEVPEYLKELETPQYLEFVEAQTNLAKSYLEKIKTQVNLEPGDLSPENLLTDTKDSWKPIENQDLIPSKKVAAFIAWAERSEYLRDEDNNPVQVQSNKRPIVISTTPEGEYDTIYQITDTSVNETLKILASEDWGKQTLVSGTVTQHILDMVDAIEEVLAESNREFIPQPINHVHIPDLSNATDTIKVSTPTYQQYVDLFSKEDKNIKPIQTKIDFATNDPDDLNEIYNQTVELKERADGLKIYTITNSVENLSIYDYEGSPDGWYTCSNTHKISFAEINGEYEQGEVIDGEWLKAEYIDTLQSSVDGWNQGDTTRLYDLESIKHELLRIDPSLDITIESELLSLTKLGADLELIYDENKPSHYAVSFNRYGIPKICTLDEGLEDVGIPSETIDKFRESRLLDREPASDRYLETLAQRTQFVGHEIESIRDTIETSKNPQISAAERIATQKEKQANLTTETTPKSQASQTKDTGR
jgi:hypothetical protein